MSRPSIFPSSGQPGVDIHGVVTAECGRLFEGHRRTLGALVKRILGAAPTVSDAAVIEYLTRGPKASVTYLKKKRTP